MVCSPGASITHRGCFRDIMLLGGHSALAESAPVLLWGCSYHKSTDSNLDGVFGRRRPGRWHTRVMAFLC